MGFVTSDARDVEHHAVQKHTRLLIRLSLATEDGRSNLLAGPSVPRSTQKRLSTGVVRSQSLCDSLTKPEQTFGEWKAFTTNSVLASKATVEFDAVPASDSGADPTM